MASSSDNPSKQDAFIADPDSFQETKYKLPLSNEIILKGHTKAVCGLSFDPSGSRLVSGGYDFLVKYWDFHGMNSDLRAFRSQEPCESYSIRDVKFSRTGDRLLFVSNLAQAKIYTRDGHPLMEFPKGDQYLLDMKNTQGHTTALNCGDWHPQSDNLCLTASMDSTIRIWDTDTKKKQKTVIVVKSRAPGGKSNVSFAKYSEDGKTIYSASEDGSIKIWSSEGPHFKPLAEILSAHQKGAYISHLAISSDKSLLVSRSFDATLKIWDLRKLSPLPLKELLNLENDYNETNCIFSPKEDLIVTGTSCKRTTNFDSKLVFIDSMLFESVYELNFKASNIIKINWHAKLNQIAVGKSDGSISMLYDDVYSEKGAKLCSKKASIKPDLVFTNATKPIYTPHSLPLFRQTETTSLRRKREKERLDPVKSHRPELPLSGLGKGGRIGSSLTQHLMKNIIKDTRRDEDPREALLKYAKLAEEDPIFIAPAYKKTQPKPIFNMEPVVQGPEDDPAQS